MHRRGWAIGIVALSFGTLGMAACGDDEPDPVSQEAYDQEAAELCERHGGEVLTTAEAIAAQPTSGAVRASFLVAEFVPRARAIVKSLDEFGFPVAKAAQYQAAVNEAIEALDEIEADAIGLIDRLNEGLLVDEENPFIDVDEAFVDLDVDCATDV